MVDRPFATSLTLEMAITRMELGETDEATRWFSRGVEVTDGAPYMVLNLAVHLRNRRWWTEALWALGPLIDVRRDAVEAAESSEDPEGHGALIPAAELELARHLIHTNELAVAEELAERWSDHPEHGDTAAEIRGLCDEARVSPTAESSHGTSSTSGESAEPPEEDAAPHTEAEEEADSAPVDPLGHLRSDWEEWIRLEKRPSFDESLTVRIWRRRGRATSNPTHLVTWSFGEISEETLLQFPALLRRYVQPLVHERPLTPREVTRLSEALAALHLGVPFCGDEGLDGETYSLRVRGVFFSTLELTWWESPPDEWAGVSELVSLLKRLTRTGRLWALARALQVRISTRLRGPGGGR